MRFLKICFPALACVFLFCIAARAADDFSKWEKEIAAFEAADKTSPPPKDAILFIGSSSIRFWTTLAQDFPNQKVINRGFGGSQIADSTHFADRIVWPYEPRQIVMLCGGNDLNAGKTPPQVADDFKAFVARVREKLPDVAIAYISIQPAPVRWAQREKIVGANRLIEAFTKTGSNLVFIDVFSKELTSDGQPNETLFREDRLHLNAKGYELLKSIVAPHLGEK